MNDVSVKVLWIYIILLLIGGMIGFFKGKSKVSLITSTVFAVLLVLTLLPHVLDRSFASNLANILLLVLLVVFAIRLGKTKKFMPAGLMLILTIVALALRNLYRG
ncbi:MAG TPA: TMEM14 family protein [Verrucomicrobiae bacterium]|jgi:uncharacterized membrane protein (UPF0136 family)